MITETDSLKCAGQWPKLTHAFAMDRICAHPTGVAKIADRDLENNTNLNPINGQAWPGSMERSDRGEGTMTEAGGLGQRLSRAEISTRPSSGSKSELEAGVLTGNW